MANGNPNREKRNSNLKVILIDHGGQLGAEATIYS